MIDGSPSVRGWATASGGRWVELTRGSSTAWVKESEFVGTQTAVWKRLADQGVSVLGKKTCDQVLAKVAALDFCHVRPLIEHSGWSGACFAFPDATVFAPEGVHDAVVVFDPLQDKCAKKGTLKGWKRHVAVKMTGQPIPMFMLMLTFMPPLLQLSDRPDNFGFELVGPGGTGKTTLQLAMSSIFGGTGRGGGGSYWITFDTTLNALEDQMAVHSDLPLIIEEANLYMAGSSAAKRAEAFKAFVFKMSGGKQKGRLGAAPTRDYRFSYLSSSNEPLAELIGQASDVAKAAGDRLITLRVGSNRPYGVFEFLPTGIGSASELAGELTAGAAAHHGTSGRRFLAELVRARATDEAELQKVIRGCVSKFARHAGIDLNNGSEVRVAEAFGLVYAAGRLAQKYGALPKKWKCGPAVLACYRQHKHDQRPSRSFTDRLSDLAAAADTVHLGRAGERPSRAGIAKANVLVLHRSSGRELLIRPVGIAAAFPNWRDLKGRADVTAILNNDKGHLTTKRKLHKGVGAERVHSFKLPAEEGE
ncbi:DUF927 domain-containing protein [Polymorphobacter sp. PAMC 29334]|uniref:DUF927 domain-containing protein n=1 Tax=Polymorphobacter sp. PAMC 29334 TaxID=2862331 RepID=UPI001C66B32D|nr:DUF927 domain-containing protein [Polymorphobacter sp. PAMC 29334]QYE35244.1 DUF927 domain-containing protein [Polymorphobacter sp. PAMC 29334]